MLFGVHIDSSYDTLLEEVNRVKKIGGNFIQLFVNNNYNYAKLNNFLKDNNMKCVVHASYTINLSKLLLLGVITI